MTDEQKTEAGVVEKTAAEVPPEVDEADEAGAMPDPQLLESLLDHLRERDAKSEPCTIELFDFEEEQSKADVLLLTCIDYRYSFGIHAIMQKKYGIRYDQVSLAGAGLSAVLDFGMDMKPHWAQTVLEHVALSIQLHQIKKVLIMDHRNCGAYERYVGLTDKSSEIQEYCAHKKHVTRLAHLLEAKFTNLEVIGILLSRLPEQPKPNDPLTYTPLYGTM